MRECVNKSPQEYVWFPQNEEECAEVHAQLARLLAHPLFSHSKRYPNFLRYLVEETLNGNEELLRERHLGVAVFHRAPDYDTTQDTIVRLTASEVRKRIAQYYHDPSHRGQLQIELLPGSYIPIFRKEPEFPARPAQPAQTAPEPGRAEFTLRISHKAVRRTLLTALLVLCLSGVWILHGNLAERRNVSHQLWAPILEEPGQVQLVPADLSQPVTDAEGEKTDGQASGKLLNLFRSSELVNYRDSMALAGVANKLALHNKQYSITLSSQINYSELQHGAAVLIGGLDNVWTMRITSGLRFHFVREGSSLRYAIEDRLAPADTQQSIDLEQLGKNVTQDYALIARVLDQTTGRPVLVLAGLGPSGTAAAARFVLDPEMTAALAAHAPADWQHKNMEAIISTRILDNHEGPPQLIRCIFW
jgi:hypothetical protein